MYFYVQMQILNRSKIKPSSNKNSPISNLFMADSSKGNMPSDQHTGGNCSSNAASTSVNANSSSPPPPPAVVK
jgi:hypothetical protein